MPTFFEWDRDAYRAWGEVAEGCPPLSPVVCRPERPPVFGGDRPSLAGLVCGRQRGAIRSAPSMRMVSPLR
jgi:hypothetical protein